MKIMRFHKTSLFLKIAGLRAALELLSVAEAVGVGVVVDRVRAEEAFVAVDEAVLVGIGVRVDRIQGVEAKVLLPDVGHAIAVRIGVVHRGTASDADLERVVESVAVRVVQEDVRAVPVLVDVRKPVAVRIL